LTRKAGLKPNGGCQSRLLTQWWTCYRSITNVELAIGDALGAAVEFETPGTFPK
jgi:hypothetical protein